MKKNEYMFIFEDEKLNTYLHTTYEERAKSILINGFFVNSYLENTCDSVYDEIFTFWYNYRKHYGNYCIVIQIPTNIDKVDELSELVDNETFVKIYNKVFNDMEEEFEFDYLIPSQFIKGYFDRVTNEFIENPLFNPIENEEII